MSAARLSSPLDPAFTDADWGDDITFYADTEAAPEPWAGSSASMSFVHRSGSVRAEASFSLTSEAGAGLVMLANGVGIRVAAAAMGDRVPGTYDFALRRHDGDAIEVALVGSIVIDQGLSEIVAGELVTGPVAAGRSYGVVKVFRDANQVRIVRNGGVAGPPGSNQAALIAFNDTLTALGVDNVQDAIVALYALIGGGPAPGPQPFYLANPGLIGAL